MVAEALARRISRTGREAAAPDVVHWLQTLLRTPLPGLGAPLADLQRLLPEMEFWLPAEKLPVPSWTRCARPTCCPASPARP
jgi:exodeoxyribonuclease V beta subunit